MAAGTEIHEQSHLFVFLLSDALPCEAYFIESRETQQDLWKGRCRGGLILLHMSVLRILILMLIVFTRCTS